MNCLFSFYTFIFFHLWGSCYVLTVLDCHKSRWVFVIRWWHHLTSWLLFLTIWERCVSVLNRNRILVCSWGVSGWWSNSMLTMFYSSLLAMDCVRCRMRRLIPKLNFQLLFVSLSLGCLLISTDFQILNSYHCRFGSTLGLIHTSLLKKEQH
jgi:hypothetical protein